jgi:hypothetical protein
LDEGLRIDDLDDAVAEWTGRGRLHAAPDGVPPPDIVPWRLIEGLDVGDHESLRRDFHLDVDAGPVGEHVHRRLGAVPDRLGGLDREDGTVHVQQDVVLPDGDHHPGEPVHVAHQRTDREGVARIDGRGIARVGRRGIGSRQGPMRPEPDGPHVRVLDAELGSFRNR